MAFLQSYFSTLFSFDTILILLFYWILHFNFSRFPPNLFVKMEPLPCQWNLQVSFSLLVSGGSERVLGWCIFSTLKGDGPIQQSISWVPPASKAALVLWASPEHWELLRGNWQCKQRLHPSGVTPEIPLAPTDSGRCKFPACTSVSAAARDQLLQCRFSLAVPSMPLSPNLL